MSDRWEEINRLLGEGKSQREIARKLNINQSNVSRQIQVKEREAPKESSAIGGSPKDRELIRLRDEVARLKREIEKQHREQIDDDEVRRIIGLMADKPVKIPPWLETVRRRAGTSSPEVPVTSWADWHAGEVVSREALNGVNEFNIDVFESRVERLIERTIYLAKEHGPGNYPGIVVNLLGDFVSGGLHPELLRTDEEEVLPTVLRVAGIIVGGLERMADEFGLVYAPAVSGNHGRATHKPEFKRYVYKNFDWLIYQFVKRELAAKKDDRIRVDVRAANEVHYGIFGQRYLAMHGDMLGVKGGDGIIGAIGPIMRGEVKVRGYAASSGLEYDMLVMGHWHQPLWLPRAIVANTLKGYCEFAKNALRAPITEPSQPLWFVHPKYRITSRWEVKVEAAPEKAAAPWVGVFQEAA